MGSGRRGRLVTLPHGPTPASDTQVLSVVAKTCQVAHIMLFIFALMDILASRAAGESPRKDTSAVSAAAFPFILVLGPQGILFFQQDVSRDGN